MDITKCSGEGCPIKEYCYRFLAKSQHYQSYFMEVPFNLETQSCTEFWNENNYKILEIQPEIKKEFIAIITDIIKESGVIKKRDLLQFNNIVKDLKNQVDHNIL